MMKKAITNRRLNVLNLFSSILVFGTGLILFTQFHVGDGAHQKEWLGLGKIFWLIIHQASAIGFLIGLAAHAQLHWKYVKMVAKRWRVNLPQKTKSTTYEQILLLIAALVVIWSGFYPWITMPGASLDVKAYHSWIDVHNMSGIVFLIGVAVHTTRRRRQMFMPMRRHNALDLGVYR